MFRYFKKKHPLYINLQPVIYPYKTPPAPRAVSEKKFIFYSF